MYYYSGYPANPYQFPLLSYKIWKISVQTLENCEYIKLQALQAARFSSWLSLVMGRMKMSASNLIFGLVELGKKNHLNKDLPQFVAKFFAILDNFSKLT